MVEFVLALLLCLVGYIGFMACGLVMRLLMDQVVTDLINSGRQWP